MTSYSIQTVTEIEQEETVALITAAFYTDPAARWLYPGAAEYLQHFPRFVRAFGGAAFHQGTAHRLADFRGAALWLRPGASSDEPALDRLFCDTVRTDIRGELSEVFEQMASYHPKGPHWHLPMIAVDPRFQGRGYGSALLAHAAAGFDEAGETAYLESSNPANIPLYERHGFVQMGEIRVGSCPPIFPMTRAPKTPLQNQAASAGR